MTNDEQTNATDDTGEEVDKPISEYDKAVELVKRREEVSKVELEILAKKETLAANDLLSGTANAGQTPVNKEETPQEYVDKMRKNGWKSDGK